MTSKKTNATLALAAFLSGASLLGATGLAGAYELLVDSQFDEFVFADYNRDGCVDWEELRNRTALIFHAVDQNGDGVIQADEHPRAYNPDGTLVEPGMLGVVTLKGYQDALHEAHERSDTDGNGCLSLAEYKGE